MPSFDRRRALRASLYAVSGQTLLRSLEPTAGNAHPAVDASSVGWVSVFDQRFAGGAKGDGSVDDTNAIALAVKAAVESGRPLYMAGTFAVANLKLLGQGRPLHVVGDPVFVQARANTPCLLVQGDPLQQLTGCRMVCTVVPHPESSKADPKNIALNLTGFSASEIVVTLGKAERHTASSGRFNTVIYADAASPFHYGNRIRLIASAVPAPLYGVRYANRGRGVNGNPNINMLSGWFYALDTVNGDVLLSVADTTQTIVEGPTLIEQCPDAIGIVAGNFTSIRDVWFERVGVAIAFGATKDTVANDCWVDRCNFSGEGQVIQLSNKIETPPTFSQCIGDFSLGFPDRGEVPGLRPRNVRSRRQPPAPSIRFTHGSGRIIPDRADLRRAVDQYGRTTYQLRYIIKPASVSSAGLRITPIDGWEVEQATLGLRDAEGIIVPCALGDNPHGGDYEWTWSNTSPHVLNIRVTLFSTDKY